MSKLLAPNGKPSNLTAEQYKLVRSSAFKKWFGDWENDLNDNMLIENGEPMIWWHTGGDWIKLNNDGINGKGKLMFSPTKKSMAYGRDGEQMITRPFFIKSDFIYMLPYEDRDITSAYRWNKNKKNPIWFVNAYGGFVVVRQSNQIKLADGTNTTFDSGNPNIRFEDGGEVYIDDLSEKSKKIIESNYNDSFGFFDFNWNNESKRENFREWLKEFEEKQFSENLDKVIGYVKSDIELIKNKNLLQLKLKAFEELIIPSLGNEVLLPKLSKFEEMVLLYSDATIESIEKGFKDAKNIIDEDGSINQSKIAPSNIFKGDYISIPAFERFVKNNPEYKGVFNDWEKIYNEEMDLSFKETYAFRYPSLEDLEYLHSELVELKDKKSKDKFNTGGEVNTGLFSQVWEWFGIKF